MLEEKTKPLDRARSGPRNRLLAPLLPEDLVSFRTHLERVPLMEGRILFEAKEPITRVYFVETGVVALAVVFENGTTAVSAIVGREGLVGVGALLGSHSELCRQVVQVTGSALAMEVSRFRGALEESPRLRTTCDAYARAFLGQVLQTIACHKVHTLEQRCARSLLMIHDRSHGHGLALRQESLAEMLGVCPATATAVARTLQNARLICCGQGVIEVLDRVGLQAAACECYGIDRERYRRLLPGAFP